MREPFALAERESKARWHVRGVSHDRPVASCDADRHRALLGDHHGATTLRNVCETEGERLFVTLADFVLRAS